jgi:hypothetical protein
LRACRRLRSELLIVQIVRDRLDSLLPQPLASVESRETYERARIRALIPELRGES